MIFFWLHWDRIGKNAPILLAKGSKCSSQDVNTTKIRVFSNGALHVQCLSLYVCCMWAWYVLYFCYNIAWLDILYNKLCNSSKDSYFGIFQKLKIPRKEEKHIFRNLRIPRLAFFSSIKKWNSYFLPNWSFNVWKFLCILYPWDRKSYFYQLLLLLLLLFFFLSFRNFQGNMLVTHMGDPHVFFRRLASFWSSLLRTEKVLFQPTSQITGTKLSKRHKTW